MAGPEQFAPSHPGGMKILLKYAGKDATEVSSGPPSYT